MNEDTVTEEELKTAYLYVRNTLAPYDQTRIAVWQAWSRQPSAAARNHVASVVREVLRERAQLDTDHPQ